MRHYRGKWGVLLDPAGGPLPAGGQVDVFTTLCGQGWFASLVAGDVATAVARLGGDASLRDHPRQELVSRGLTGSAGRSPIAPDHTVSRVMFAVPRRRTHPHGQD